jgi:hypothetical protein
MPTSSKPTLPFISSNPAIEAFRAGEQAALQRELADLELAAAPSRLRMINAQADTAEANARLAQGTLQPRIAQAEVEARYAEPAAQARLRQQNAAALNAEMAGFYKSLDLLNAGRVEEAQMVARATGQQIPPEVVNNATLRGLITATAKRAQELYPDRPAAQQSYIDAQMQSLRRRREAGEPLDALLQPYTMPPGAPPPQETTKGSYDLVYRQEIDPATGQTIVRASRFDKKTGEITPIEGEGAFLRSTGPGSSGRMSVFEQKRAAWLAVYPGDLKGALEYASGRRQMSEPEIAKAALQLAGTEIRGNQMLRFRNVAEQQAAIQKRAAEIAQQIRSGFAEQGMTTAPPPGAGTRENPYQATTQQHVDWFRNNAPAGAVISINGQLYTK